MTSLLSDGLPVAGVIRESSVRVRPGVEHTYYAARGVVGPMRGCAVATNISEETSAPMSRQDPFAEGWLNDHLSKVVRDLASRPEPDRPQLTGERAATMRGSAWLKVRSA